MLKNLFEKDTKMEGEAMLKTKDKKTKKKKNNRGVKTDRIVLKQLTSLISSERKHPVVI